MAEDAADKTADAGTDHINIRVQNQEGSVIHFKIKKTTPLKKLMNAYCTRLGVKQTSVRFIFDGDTVKDSDTPDALGMQNDDNIEVFQSQTGLHLAVLMMLFFALSMTVIGIVMSIIAVCRHDLVIRLYNFHSASEFFLIAGLAMISAGIVYPINAENQLRQLAVRKLITLESKPRLPHFFQFIRDLFAQQNKQELLPNSNMDADVMNLGLSYGLTLACGIGLIFTAAFMNLDCLAQASVKPKIFHTIRSYFASNTNSGLSLKNGLNEPQNSRSKMTKKASPVDS